MSLTRRCDWFECTQSYEVAFGATDNGFPNKLSLPWYELQFCSPEHLVLFMFAQYPEMPLWYGPKTQAMAEAMNG